MKFVIEHLKKRYEKKEVLQDIDFTFETGKIYGLLGRNGAGKTLSLIHISDWILPFWKSSTAWFPYLWCCTAAAAREMKTWPRP